MNLWLTAVVLGVMIAGLLASFADEAAAAEAAPAKPPRGPLDPRGQLHIPIGIPNTLDSLKTFVEAEGNFSPGVATYGIYFWVYDLEAKKLVAPTMDGVASEHGLLPGGALVPWCRWEVAGTRVTTTVSCSPYKSPAGDGLFVGAQMILAAPLPAVPRKLRVYAALRSLGPAGGPVNQLATSDEGDALLVDGHPALVALAKPTGAGVVATDTVGNLAMEGRTPGDKTAASASGDCSGAIWFDVDLPAGVRTLSFICPVLPDRRAVPHQWDGKSEWAQFDLAKPNPAEGGVLQPDAGLEFWRRYRGQDDQVHDAANTFWVGFLGSLRVKTPDVRWSDALGAIVSHAAIAMNDGAPDVAVVNYNVFNRDGVYTANILQKSGQFDLAAKAIDYFLAHPFNGRVYPEADNPGQILWIMGEHWLFTRDKKWLERVYPSVQQIAAMIRYYRTEPGPHWVCMDSLKFGKDAPADQRQELKPGRCDGDHPEYTEAFDIAGLWRATMLAQALGRENDAADWSGLADSLLATYEARFGSRLAKDYGSYAVLWPCRLFPVGEGRAFDQFKNVGMQKPSGWRYSPLATAHQGLLAGNRDAACATLEAHLDHEQMRGWYAFDEGGKSGSGGWRHIRTTWNGDVAMPHGWAIAEFWLLLRDSLLFEDGDHLVLLAGVPQAWLTGKEPIRIQAMPTYFGPCTFTREAAEGGAKLTLAPGTSPPDGYVLRLPAGLKARVTAGGKPVQATRGTDFRLPAGTTQVEVRFAP